MDIKEIKQKKCELEERIRNLLMDFYEQPGLVVSSLDVIERHWEDGECAGCVKKIARTLTASEQFIDGIDYQVMRNNAHNLQEGRPAEIYYLNVPCLEFFDTPKMVYVKLWSGCPFRKKHVERWMPKELRQQGEERTLRSSLPSSPSRLRPRLQLLNDGAKLLQRGSCECLTIL